MWSSKDHKTIRKTFRSLADARAWRAEALTGLRRGVVRAPTRTTLNQEAESWLALAKGGTVRTRSGNAYKPSALRSYAIAARGTFDGELRRADSSVVGRIQALANAR